MLFQEPHDLLKTLKTAWSLESSRSWSKENPAKGQCSVTALIVEDLFGGEILKTKTIGGTHFYNRIDGIRHDLTSSQFAEPIHFDDASSSRQEAFLDTSVEQYTALRLKLGLSSKG